MKIIGITGNMRSGKDTVAKRMVQTLLDHRKKGLVVHFADHLKEITKLAMGWTDQHVYGDLKDVTDPNWLVSPRYVLQTLGTEYFRKHVDEQFWVKFLLSEEKINHYYKKGVDYLIIPDVRFNNEAEKIKELGGAVLRVKRDGVNITQHASEAGVDDKFVDGNITNNSTLLWLHHMVDAKVLQILGYAKNSVEPTLEERLSEMRSAINRFNEEVGYDEVI
jgi:hypothetical protein